MCELMNSAIAYTCIEKYNVQDENVQNAWGKAGKHTYFDI